VKKCLSILAIFTLTLSLSVSLFPQKADAAISNPNYTYGFNLGKNLEDVYWNTIEVLWEFSDAIGMNKEEALSSASSHVEILEEWYPEHLLRLKGLSQALDMPLVEVVAASIYMPSFLLRGCTTSVSAPPATQDGQVYLSWNVDIWATLKLLVTGMDLPLFTVTDIPGHNKYITFGIPLMAGIGVLNDKGLALVGNAVLVGDEGDGLTALEIPNMVMERCSTAEEAAKLIESLERFSSSSFSLFNLNYLFADAEGGIASIEATHNYFAVNCGEDGILAQANHHQWLDRSLTGAPGSGPDGYPSSWIRAERMRELLRENHGSIDLEKVKSFTADIENGVEIGSLRQGGYNSISRTMFPLGWLDYYQGSLTGKYMHEGKPAVLADLVILGPDQTNVALIIEPKDKIIWWCPGWPACFDYYPVYCAGLLGVEGPSIQPQDGASVSLLNHYVGCCTQLGGTLSPLPSEVPDSINGFIVWMLKAIASMMKILSV